MAERIEQLRTVEEVLGVQALAKMGLPLGEASSLPNTAYTSDEFLALENERLFPRTWVLAGFVHQLPEPGSILPVRICGRPVMLVRTKSGEIRAFHNVCPHRGTQLVDRACRRAAITCPYHAWSFTLEGDLKGRPHFHGPDEHDTADDDAVHLAAVACGVWFDFVFVNLSGDAEPFEAYIAPVKACFGDHDLSALKPAGMFSQEVPANWKLALENYIEPYHVFALHPRLLTFAPMSIRTPSSAKGGFFYNEYTVSALESGRGADLPHFPGLDAEQMRRGFWFNRFPSFALEVYADQLVLFRVIPLAPDRTLEEFHIYLVGDAADSDSYAAARADVFKTWKDLNDEDVGILERLQIGRQSPGFDGGSLSPYWDEAPLEFARCVLNGVR